MNNAKFTFTSKTYLIANLTQIMSLGRQSTCIIVIGYIKHVLRIYNSNIVVIHCCENLFEWKPKHAATVFLAAMIVTGLGMLIAGVRGEGWGWIEKWTTFYENVTWSSDKSLSETPKFV